MMTTVEEVMEATGWRLDEHGLYWEHRQGGMMGRQEVEDNLGLLGIRPAKSCHSFDPSDADPDTCCFCQTDCREA